MQHKMKSRERGAAWLYVANRLAPSFPSVEITSRAVRDHFKVIERKRKFNMAEKERSTGIAGDELTEAEGLLEELIDISEKTEKRIEEENETRRGVIEKEKVQGIAMRQRAMESIGETRNGHGRENENPEKKRRRSGEATFEWLREKAAMEKNFREEGLKERREEQES